MGVKGIRGGRPPSHVAYYVAMAGILGLLLMLCAYFFYFCVRRVKELSTHGLPEIATPRPAPPPTAAYPVQPEVRESATAMARLCQLPARSAPASPASPVAPRAPPALPPPTGPPRSATVFPRRSPRATPAPLSPPVPLPPPTIIPPRARSPRKPPPPSAAELPVLTVSEAH